MKIETIPIDKINPSAYNPRVDLKPDDPAYIKIKKSLDSFGLVEPLVLNKRTGNLVSGHQRLKILKESGTKEVPCSVIDCDEREEKALNISLNKVQGDWDFSSLADILLELDDGSFDVELTGFDMAEIEDMATWTPDPDPESNKEVKRCHHCGGVIK